MSTLGDNKVCGFLGLAFLALLCLPFVYHTKLWYDFKYSGDGVKWADIHMYDKPHDCDWSKAPIGDKECHYEISDTEVVSPESGGPYEANIILMHVEIYVLWEKVSE